MYCASYAPGAGTTASGPAIIKLRRYQGPAISSTDPNAVRLFLVSVNAELPVRVLSKGTIPKAGNSTSADCLVHNLP